VKANRLASTTFTTSGQPVPRATAFGLSNNEYEQPAIFVGDINNDAIPDAVVHAFDYVEAYIGGPTGDFTGRVVVTDPFPTASASIAWVGVAHERVWVAGHNISTDASCNDPAKTALLTYAAPFPAAGTCVGYLEQFSHLAGVVANGTPSGGDLAVTGWDAALHPYFDAYQIGSHTHLSRSDTVFPAAFISIMAPSYFEPSLLMYSNGQKVSELSVCYSGICNAVTPVPALTPSIEYGATFALDADLNGHYVSLFSGYDGVPHIYARANDNTLTEVANAVPTVDFQVDCTAPIDVDRDLTTDLVEASLYTNDGAVQLGEGDGTFNRHARYNDIDAIVAIADMDGDGDDDVLALSIDGLLNLYSSDKGELALVDTLLTETAPEFVLADDFFGEGRKSILLQSNTGELAYYQLTSDMHFAARTAIATSVPLTAISRLVDVSGTAPGNDFVLVDPSAGQVTAHYYSRNAPAAIVGTQSPSQPTGSNTLVAIGDLGGPLAADVAVAWQPDVGHACFSTLRWAGEGTAWVPVTPCLVGSDLRPLGIADKKARFLLSQGAGRKLITIDNGTATATLTAPGETGIVLDLNHDGHDDFVLADDEGRMYFIDGTDLANELTPHQFRYAFPRALLHNKGADNLLLVAMAGARLALLSPEGNIFR